MKAGDVVTYVDASGTHSATVTAVHEGPPNPILDLSFSDKQRVAQVRTSVVHRDSSPTPTSYWY